jgi:hypothetical protein
VPTGPRPVLHVTNGDSAAQTLQETSLGGDVLAWRDALHEGPVPDVSSDGLRDVRAAFLGGCGWGAAAMIRKELARRDELLASAASGRRPVVLWFEHDLYDQLQLLQVLDRIGEAGGPGPDLVRIVQVGSFEGRPSFHGLGELSAAELESLWPSRTPVTGELVEQARRAWAAVRAPEPTAMEALAREDVPGLPFLGNALRRLLEELPEAGSGLSRSERQVLEAIAAGARTPVEVLAACQAREGAPFEGDTWAFRRMADLGAIGLLRTADGTAFPTPPPRGDHDAFARASFALTDAGRAVLAGENDRVALGLDRWVGGTHLHAGAPWRWDREEAGVVQAARARMTMPARPFASPAQTVSSTRFPSGSSTTLS